MKKADMRDDRQEVNHCRGSSEMPNQVESGWSKMKWLRKGVEGAREIKKAKARYLLMGDSLCEMIM